MTKLMTQFETLFLLILILPPIYRLLTFWENKTVSLPQHISQSLKTFLFFSRRKVTKIHFRKLSFLVQNHVFIILFDLSQEFSLALFPLIMKKKFISIFQAWVLVLKSFTEISLKLAHCALAIWIWFCDLYVSTLKISIYFKSLA